MSGNLAAHKLVRLVLLSGLAVGLALWALAGDQPEVAAQAPPAIASSLVATQEMSSVPPGHHWTIRGEHALNVEHSHAGGFIYQMAGSSVLRMEGQEVTLQEGQGIWVPEGVAHTHKADAGAQLWSFSLEIEPDQGAAQPLFTSKELGGVAERPHLARLLSDQYPAGATTPPHRHYGPEAVFVRQGGYELNYAGAVQSYKAGQGYTVEPLIPHRLTNPGPDQARLFNLSLVPLGRVTGEPLGPEMLR
jgi:quercetin dioxygenase-like cupin family protein